MNKKNEKEIIFQSLFKENCITMAVSLRIIVYYLREPLNIRNRVHVWSDDFKVVAFATQNFADEIEGKFVRRVQYHTEYQLWNSISQMKNKFGRFYKNEFVESSFMLKKSVIDLEP